MSDLTALLLSMHSQDDVRDTYVRAPMGYPGSKTRSLKELLPHLPYRNTWVDVCGGTGSVTLARDTCKLDVYNDRHSGLVAFYRCIRDPFKCKAMVDRLLISPPCSREEFMWSRDTWKENQLDDVERASRWYYALQTSFNQKGWAFGRATKGNAQGQKMFNNVPLFWPLHNRMRNVQIENQDYRMLFKDYCNGPRGSTVFYVDPPYWGTSGIYEHQWSEQDHIELCERIPTLNGSFVAVSGYDLPNHPYNRYTYWTDKVSWEVRTSLQGYAETETNHMEGHMDFVRRENATETLWIYDPK